MPDVTEVLEALERGEPAAAEQLLPLVYDELRRLAAQLLTRESPGHTLQPTALVHEAYLRLVPAEPSAAWQGRRHFFGAAAEAMRRILVEAARRRRRLKRGGDQVRHEFDEALVLAAEPREDLLALDEALTRLAEVDPAAARLVQLRYFAGLSIPEAAEALEISARSADRLWAFARAWLHRAMEEPNPPGPPSRSGKGGGEH